MRFQKLIPLSFHKIENVILRNYVHQVNIYPNIFIIEIMCKLCVL